MNFDIETFNKFDFTGSQITNHNVHVRQSEKTLLEFNLATAVNIKPDAYINMTPKNMQKKTKS